MAIARHRSQKDSTDDLVTALANDKLSGLLSATMGNLVEIIMSFALIRGRQFSVLQLPLVGTLLSSAALVFGTSVLCVCEACSSMKSVRRSLWVYSTPSATATAELSHADANVTMSPLPADPSDANTTCQRATAVLLLFLYRTDIVFQLFVNTAYLQQEGRAW